MEFDSYRPLALDVVDELKEAYLERTQTKSKSSKKKKWFLD